MTPRPTTFSIPVGGAATLTFAETPTPESIGRLEQDLGRMPRNDMRGLATDDPGAIEFDSWIAQLH